MTNIIEVTASLLAREHLVDYQADLNEFEREGWKKRAARFLHRLHEQAGWRLVQENFWRDKEVRNLTREMCDSYAKSTGCVVSGDWIDHVIKSAIQAAPRPWEDS